MVRDANAVVLHMRSLQPGFCLKTHDDKDAKIFINVCHSAEVPEATAKGLNWSVPNNISPPRMERDKGSTPCLTFDFCINTKTLARAGVQKAFKDMLCSGRDVARGFGVSFPERCFQCSRGRW